MATYSYTKAYSTLDEGKLMVECQAAGLPVSDVQRLGDPAETVYVITSRDLSGAEKTTLDGVVTAHDGRARRKRLLHAIWTDLGALTSQQKTNIAADLFGGSPPRFTQDRGENAADLLVIYVLQQLGGLSNADKALVKQAAAAIYCLDNPKYLVHPSFDVSINLPGDELDV